MQLLTFVLGSLFTFFLQFISARLALQREQAKETWIRRLNSYQDFRAATLGLLELWSAGARVPRDRAWAALSDARKAALDAAVFDPGQDELTARMREMTVEIAQLIEKEDRPEEEVLALEEESAHLWKLFSQREQVLRAERKAWWRRRVRGT